MISAWIIDFLKQKEEKEDQERPALHIEEILIPEEVSEKSKIKEEKVIEIEL